MRKKYLTTPEAISHNRKLARDWYHKKKKTDPVGFEEYRKRQLESARKWRLANPLLVTGARFRFSILKRDNFTCQYCGQKAPNVVLHIDHKKPSSKGGPSTLENCVTACEECNLGKSDSLL